MYLKFLIGKWPIFNINLTIVLKYDRVGFEHVLIYFFNLLESLVKKECRFYFNIYLPQRPE